MLKRHPQYDHSSDNLTTKYSSTSLSECVKQLNVRACSEFDLHNLSYTISSSVDYSNHPSYNQYYSSNNSLNSFNSPDFGHSFHSDHYLNNNDYSNYNLNYNLPNYSPIIDNQLINSNEKNCLSKLKKRKQFFVNKSEMKCNLKMFNPKLVKKQNSSYFDPESLVSFTLQSNVKKSSKSTPCLNETSLNDNNDENVLSVKTKKQRKGTINWPFKRSSSNTRKQKNTSVPNSPLQQIANKTVNTLHKKILNKSQSTSNMKNKPPSTNSRLSIMSTVTLKRSNHKKQTIKLFGQPIDKLCLGDHHLITPVKNMLIELIQRAPQTVGIFRKSANARVCRELKAELEINPDCSLNDYPIIVIASVFKELLRSLPDCLLVGNLYSKWLEAARRIENSSNNNDCSSFVRSLTKCLPKSNYLLLQYFLCILYHITLNSNENKMNAENLAVCVGPSLLNHDVAPSSMNCELSKQVPKLIAYLITNIVELFGSSALNLFDSYNLPIDTKNQTIIQFEDDSKKRINDKVPNKDSGAEESDSVKSLNDVDNIKQIKTISQVNSSDKERSNGTISILNSDQNSHKQSSFYTNHHNLLHPNSDKNFVNSNAKSFELQNSFSNLYHLSPSSLPSNSFYSSSSITSSTNSAIDSTKSYNSNNSDQNINSFANSASSSLSTSSAKTSNNCKSNENNPTHQSFFGQTLRHQQNTDNYAVNKVSLSNLSRDSGLTLSDTQLYSPEEDDDDEDDYHHIINHHLHLHKKINKIVGSKCVSKTDELKTVSNKLNTLNSTSLKKKCNKINRINATSSEEDDSHFDIEDEDDVLDDDQSEKSCTSDNCSSLYSRIYQTKHKHSDQCSLVKSAPQLANIDNKNSFDNDLRKKHLKSIDKASFTSTKKQEKNKSLNSSLFEKNLTNLKNNNLSKVTSTTIPLYLKTIKNDSVNSTQCNNSPSCNSPSSTSSSILSSTSLGISSDNSSPDLSRNYLTSTPQQINSSTPSSNINIKVNQADHSFNLIKNKLCDNISSVENSLNTNIFSNLKPKSNCNISIDQSSLNNNQKLSHLKASSLKCLNNSTNTQCFVPPSYQETMNRKEIKARMENLAQTSIPKTISRKIFNSEIDNLVSKKIYEKSLYVYNADVNKNLTLRAVPVQVKNQSFESDSDTDNQSKMNYSHDYSKKSIDQVDSLINTSKVSIKPIVQQRCAKDSTEYWKKDVSWSVATLRSKFTELCKKNQNIQPMDKNTLPKQKKIIVPNEYKLKNSVNDFRKCSSDNFVDINNQNYLNQNPINGNSNCVTIIKINHGKDKAVIEKKLNEESYV